MKKLKHIIKQSLKKIILSLSLKRISKPIFIIGCGRSGTTILGNTLSKHSKITYLNERRDLWFSAYPESDIWTHKAADRNGKMVMNTKDADAGKSKKLHKTFRMETLKTRKPILIEKLPINNFRLDFINTIFPNARYIHIHRNGLEVASSIEKKVDTNRWFGSNDYKWNQLVDVSKKNNQTQPLSDMCSANYDKGLLEWRLSTEAVVKFLKELHQEKYLEISYANLTNAPVNTINQILSFIGIDSETAVTNFAKENISRRSKKISAESISEKETIIGGDLLRFSMINKKGLTQHFLEEKGLHK